MKRKILFFIESLAGGGAEKVLTTLVQHIDKEKFDITLCVVSGGGKYETEVKNAVRYVPIFNSPEKYRGIMKFWYIIKYHLFYDWLPMSWVYRLFIPKDNDVEVAFVEGFATRLFAASSNRKAKKIAWVHIDLHRFHWTRSIFKSDREEETAYNSYDQIITVSQSAEEAMKQEFNLHVPVMTVYNPIDADEIKKLASEVIIDSTKDYMRLVSVGRLNKQKAYDRLLRIVSRLKAEGYRFELWLLGQGEDKAKLDSYIKENSLDDTVKLLGFQTNPYAYLAQCDLFVCSSISEGFSTAITEALILGLPVVSTEVSGVREQLNNGCGIITENDEDALYQGIRKVLDKPEILPEMKKHAIERSKDFQIESLMKEIEAALS